MQPEITHNIFLTGFMGAGKSTVGKILADLLKCAYSDLDDMIVQREKRTIAEIFAAEGEDYFRDCETTVLQSLRSQPAAVYATGGGLVVRDENRRQMQILGRVVYLKASWPTLMNRLQQSTDRPLVTPERDWHNLNQLWTKRQVFYEDADIVVETDGLTPLQVAQKIASGLTS
ncbi:MAG: shikimate kinase [Desulfuromonadales bacterium]|nr:shikimate kinase [Desulfuromonadales bacterium]